MTTNGRVDSDGVMDSIAYLLAHWPHPVVQRSTVRAFLPTGTRRELSEASVARKHAAGRANASTAVNRVTQNFQDHLRHFDRAGWIRREGEQIRILERGPLVDLGGRLEQGRAELFTNAITRLKRQDAEARNGSPEARERRRQELLAMERLMQDVARHRDSGRGTVRLLPRGGTL